MIGALLAQTATIFILGLRGEPGGCAIRVYLKWGTVFYFSNFFAIGAMACLTVGVNIMVHEFFNDLGPYHCSPKSPDDMCEPPAAMAWVLNAMSIVCFAGICFVFYFSIMAKQPGRRLLLAYEQDRMASLSTPNSA